VQANRQLTRSHNNDILKIILLLPFEGFFMKKLLIAMALATAANAWGSEIGGLNNLSQLSGEKMCKKLLKTDEEVSAKKRQQVHGGAVVILVGLGSLGSGIFTASLGFTQSQGSLGQGLLLMGGSAIITGGYLIYRGIRSIFRKTCNIDITISGKERAEVLEELAKRERCGSPAGR
jgi:hypothetical protein